MAAKKFYKLGPRQIWVQQILQLLINGDGIFLRIANNFDILLTTQQVRARWLHGIRGLSSARGDKNFLDP